jgi:uncharacterized protein YyaL (SSP411 family)
MPNRLADQTSPYLLQHAHNPVDWYPWGPEALERARAEDRPIFLSIGYSACHWCHVMERESFENPEIAAQLNRDFVAIKVDREERPDLDDLYMAAVQAMTGSGGWPMSVFLTPGLKPFYGGTYFPPEDRHGIPGLPRVLDAVAEAFRDRRSEVEAQGQQLVVHLRDQLDVRAGTTDPEQRQLQVAARRLVGAFDPANGGFGGAPKFPAPMSLEFLMRTWQRTGEAELLRVVTVTLDRMADGGIFDQLGGGFARYSTDARWLVPHFEKMLYDNAQLAHCYLEAHRATGSARYAEVARRTLEFMVRELVTADGGLASALDADSEGEEGRFYTWRLDEVISVLEAAGLDAAQRDEVVAHWGISADGNWEGRSILSVARQAAGEPPPAVLERARQALLEARDRRTRPGRDEKQLAAWNGMAMRALADGALVLGDDRLAEATARLVAFVRRDLLRDGDRLWRTARGGQAHTPGFAEDYANIADGLLAAHAALGDPDLLELAEALLRRVLADFRDPESGTLFDTGPEHEQAFTRPRSVIDSATPSANAVAADVLLRLAILTGDAELDRAARGILRAVAPAVERQPSAFGRMLCAIDRSLGAPIDAVVAGEPRDPAALALRRAVARPYAPNLVIAALPSGSSAVSLAIFAGKSMRDGRATAYVCRGYACEEPTPDAARAEKQVRDLSATGAGGDLSREGS